MFLPFSDRLKILENNGQFFFFLILNFAFFKQKCENRMLEYIETVTKRHFYQIKA